MRWKKFYFLNKIIIFIIIFLFLNNRCSPDIAPTDQELKSHFLKNRKIFEEYVNLFITNNELHTIRYNNDYMGRVYLNRDITSIDNNKILSDMKNILKIDLITRDAPYATIRYGIIEEISFYSYNDVGGKGISYFIHGNPKTIIEKTLDKYDLEHKQLPPEVERVHSKIGDGWYIFLEFY